MEWSARKARGVRRGAGGRVQPRPLARRWGPGQGPSVRFPAARAQPPRAPTAGAPGGPRAGREAGGYRGRRAPALPAARRAAPRWV